MLQDTQRIGEVVSADWRVRGVVAHAIQLSVMARPSLFVPVAVGFFVADVLLFSCSTRTAGRLTWPRDQTGLLRRPFPPIMGGALGSLCALDQESGFLPCAFWHVGHNDDLTHSLLDFMHRLPI